MLIVSMPRKMATRSVAWFRIIIPKPPMSTSVSCSPYSKRCERA